MRFFIITALLYLIIGTTSSFASDSSSVSDNNTSSCDDVFNKGSLDSYSTVDKKIIEEIRNKQGWARLYEDGTLLTTSSSDNESIKSIFTYVSWFSLNLHDIVDITSTRSAFMALRENGSVIIWGKELDIDVNSVSRLYDIDAISSNKYTFFAIKKDRSSLVSVNTVPRLPIVERIWGVPIKPKTKTKPGIIIIEREPDTPSEFYKGFKTKKVKVPETSSLLIQEYIWGIPIKPKTKDQVFVRICSDPSKLKIEEKE